MIFEKKLSRLESILALGNQSPPWRQMALMDAEHSLTPLEFQRVVRNLCARFPNAQAVLQNLLLAQLLATEAPTPYVRSSIAPDVTLFHNPDVPCVNKSIVIAFCGKAQRLLIPTGVFLQLLPSADVDVVILTDPRRSHFARGLQEYAADFFQFVTRLDKDLKLNRYKNVCCYGTSMGGFVALRCGLLLGTKSVSVGGKFPWHVQRLLTGQTMPAFDLLCSCKASAAVSFVCVYGNNADDLRAVDHLATMFPVTRLHIQASHNVIFAMYKEGTLRQFYRVQFAFDPTVAGKL